MIALVDADSLLYKVCFAIEDKVFWNESECLAGLSDEREEEYYSDLQVCKKTFDDYVSGIKLATGCDEMELVFSGSGNFRLDLPTPYKGNRDKLRKPLYITELLEYAKEKYKAIVVEGMEADDYVVYQKTAFPEEYYLCAMDKDVLYQTVGRHFNYYINDDVVVNEKKARKFPYYQTLVGDTTDGYKGCPQIGDARATKILDGLETEQEMWEAVVETYEKKGLTEDDATLQMQLANMHQFDGIKINLWTPKVLVL